MEDGKMLRRYWRWFIQPMAYGALSQLASRNVTIVRR
jgi:hypothetical protein